MPIQLEQTVEQWIETSGLISSGDQVLLAVSGGADSVAMAAVLVRLRIHRLFCRKIVVGHVNHHLRGSASDEDERFVIRLAEQWGLAVLCRSVNVMSHSRIGKLSIETSARQLRLAALIEMAAEADCSRIATAHHADDQVETILHRLERGTGFRGLCGIMPSRPMTDRTTLIRPMLHVTRSEIVAYCRQQGLAWRDDATNDSLDHTRNRIRHILRPQIEQVDPRLGAQLLELSSNCRMLQERIDRECQSMWSGIIRTHSDTIILDRRKLAGQPQPIRIELVRRALVGLGCGEQNLGDRQYRFLDQLIAGPDGRKRNLPNGLVARTSEGNLILGRKSSESDNRDIVEIELPVSGNSTIGNFALETRLIERNPGDVDDFFRTKDQDIEWLDMDSIFPPIRVRRRRPGDRFVPLGQSEEKKVGKFLTAQRAPDRLRRRILIVEDSRGILWVAPLRISEQARIRPGTRRILEIRIRPGPLKLTFAQS
jgi:tRNA(Ile)-lysidine synthase